MTTLYVLGDSVAAPRAPHEEPMHGWGDYLSEHLDSDLTVHNFARSEMTTRKYFTERFAQLLNRIRPNDVVLIQLGTVDAMIHDATRYVPVPEYREWLSLFAEYLRNSNAIPVFVTPVQRHTFDSKRKVQSTRGDHPEAMREVARLDDVPLIDLELISTDFWNIIGPEQARSLYCWVDPGTSAFAPGGVIDTTHLSLYGAKLTAALVARELWGMDHLRDGIFVTEPPVMTAASIELSQMRSSILEGEKDDSSRNSLDGKPYFTLVSPIKNTLSSPFLKFSGEVSGEIPEDSFISLYSEDVRLGGTTLDAEGRWQWRHLEAFPDGISTLVVQLENGNSVYAETSITVSVSSKVDKPEIGTPRDGGFSDTRPVFSGTANPTTTKIVFWHEDRLIGACGVDKDGKWSFSHSHDWKQGTYLVQISSIRGALESVRASVEFSIVAPPEEGGIRRSKIFMEECKAECSHRPFSGQ